MTRKAILSICDTCKEPKPCYAFRRDAEHIRHGSCVLCEDALARAKAQRMSDARAKKNAYARQRYAAATGCKKNPVIVATRWVGGTYPGVQT